MIRLYAIIFVIALLGGTAYAAKYYYDTTQATIAQLRENNAKLEVANEENQQTITKIQENNIALNQDQSEKNIKLTDALEDLDDVQEVHTNAEFPEDFTEEE